MTTLPHTGARPQRGPVTLSEIRQQPELWPGTLASASTEALRNFVADKSSIICGAGTSAYAALAVASNWKNSLAVPTTDLLLSSKQEILRALPAFANHGLLVSLARSGNSPESIGVVQRFQELFPLADHLAITCNPEGHLARMPGVRALVLDPRTNDRSLVMTSSFSNLALAGIAIAKFALLEECLPRVASVVANSFSSMEVLAQRLAAANPSRVLILTPPGLVALGKEASLKILEITAGKVMAMTETFLGLRHGPMTYLRSDALVLCVLSSNPQVRQYEVDVLREIRAKNLGHLVVIGSPTEVSAEYIPSMAPELDDALRVPFDIVFPQLLSYYLSLANGLDPDNPSPDGIITRVVQQFQLHDIPSPS